MKSHGLYRGGGGGVKHEFLRRLTDLVTTNFLHIVTLINRTYFRSELVVERGAQRIVLKTFTNESEARIYLTDFLRRLNHGNEQSARNA